MNIVCIHPLVIGLLARASDVQIIVSLRLLNLLPLVRFSQMLPVQLHQVEQSSLLYQRKS